MIAIERHDTPKDDPLREALCGRFLTRARMASGITAALLLATAWVWVGFPKVCLDLGILPFALGCVWIPDLMQRNTWQVGREVPPQAVAAMGWLLLFFPLACHLLSSRC